ncbi:MAG TPA: NAD(P)-dependent alcohol dehydrogenase, partial [Gaiellaceae bacterium]|nr:NAD(P)-dependent alcohol dehydrogenase [Gaiellaceae bacterium]
MRAVVHRRYGGPEVLELVELEKPTPADDEVLVRVRASSVNPADWYSMTGLIVARPTSGLRRPKEPRIGVDFSGVVEAVGPAVTDFAPGDEVYGGRTGALAEYVCVKNAIAKKPANLTFEEAAAVPVAAITALQGLRDKGALQSGNRVLIDGGSGGVGTFAVQIAKALGASHVTAVCSTRNVEQAAALGADRVIDYTKEDFTAIGERFDVLLDIAVTRSYRRLRRLLDPSSRLVIVGAPKSGTLLGPLGRVLKIIATSLGRKPKARFFIAKLTRDELEALNELLEAGTVKPVVERTYPLAEIA